MRLFLLLMVSLSFISLSYADDDYFGSNQKRTGFDAVNNDLYKSSCASCHFAYQPGFLPSRSWQKMMQPSALLNHFGDNAELIEQDRLLVLKYLQENAADTTNSRRSKRIMRSLNHDDAPLRITDLRYFKQRHHEVPARFVTGNPQVRSFGNCIACHTTANTGSYSERAIRIPGVGRWEDD